MRHVRYLSFSFALILLIFATGCGQKGADKPEATPSPTISEFTPSAEPVAAPSYSESPEPTSSMFPTHGYCNGEGVNLRAEPNTSASIVDIMGANTELELLALQDGWFMVKTGDQTAYVAESLITIGTPPRKDNMHWAKITAKEAQLYGSPNDEDLSDTKLKKDEVLKVLRKVGNYLHVVYNRNLQCYVHASDVSYISEAEFNGGTPPPTAKKTPAP